MPVLCALRDKLARNFLCFCKNAGAETALLLGVPDLTSSELLWLDFLSRQVSTAAFHCFFRVDLRKHAGQALPA